MIVPVQKRYLLQIFSLQEVAKVKQEFYFVGTGPGAKDLITIRGANILKNADTVLYGASQVPEAVFDHCPADVELINIDSFALEETIRTIHLC